MATIQSIEAEIRKLKERNKRVEADKAWETSTARKAAIAVLTYAVVVLFFFAAGIGRPWINAIVPTAGFLLSTLSLDALKKWWLDKMS